MTGKQSHLIPYGTGLIETNLPDRTRIIEAPPSLPALPDPAGAVLEALNQPVGHEPLAKLVSAKSKVTIACDDPCHPRAPGMQPDFRETALKVLLQELDRHGVSRQNIQIIVANGLHRKWTRKELSHILGKDIVYFLPPHKLYCHDAEDKDYIVTLGETRRNMLVEVSRAVTESDQLFYININSSPFNGGWKSIVVGLSSYRSIRQHHRPFPMASGKSVMDPKRSSFQKLLWEMGDVVTGELEKKGRRILTIESVPTSSTPVQTAAVFAGNINDVHERTLNVLQNQMVTEVEGQSDLVIYGLSTYSSPYSKYSVMNPILVRNAAFSYAFGMFQGKPLVREGGIAIFVHPCELVFSDLHSPSYIRMYNEILPEMQDPFEIWDTYSEDYAHRSEFVHNYRYRYSYHGVHPIILWGQGVYARRHLSRAFLAGAQNFELARLMGFEPFATVEDAVSEAENLLGKDCSISYVDTPPQFIHNVI